MTNELFNKTREPNAVLKDIPVNRIHPAVIDIVKAMAPINCFVAGGYARWACSERENSPKPTDVDVIALTDDAFDQAKKVFSLVGASICKDTEFSITYAQHTAYNCPLQVQLLKNYKYDTLEAALSRVDFSVCRVALIDEYTARADMRFSGHERDSRLSILYVDPHAVNNVVCRMLRYAQKGYDISQLDVLRVLHKVKECDLDDPGLVPQEALNYRDVAS